MEVKSYTERAILIELAFTLREETTFEGMSEKVVDALRRLDKKFVSISKVINDDRQLEIHRYVGDSKLLNLVNSQLQGLSLPSFHFEGWRWNIHEPWNIYAQMCRERKILASDNTVTKGSGQNIILAPIDKIVRDFIPGEHISHRAFRFIPPKTWLRLIGYNAVICAPFMNGNKVAGVLAVIGAADDPPLGQDDIDLMQSVANLCTLHLTSRSRRAELEASEAKWTALISHAPEGIALCAEDSIILGNPAFTRLTGLVPPCPMKDFQNLFVRKEERETYIKRFSGPSETPGAFEVALKAPSDSERIVRVSYSFFHDKGTRNLLLSLHDVTEERRLAADLAEQERIASLGVVAASLSHELNNPLAAVTTHVELLEKKCIYSKETSQFFGVISRNLEKMKKMLHELTRFAEDRIPAPQTVSLRSVLGECIEEMREYLDAHRVEIVRNFSDFDDSIETDPRLLRQAIANLITNAVAAMEKEPRRIVISCEPAGQDGRAAIVRLRDNGIGISPEIRDRIFEPFFSARKGARGTGLGLAIVKKIVRTHRGSISFDSTPGEGTTFSITLPIKTRPLR